MSALLLRDFNGFACMNAPLVCLHFPVSFPQVELDPLKSWIAAGTEQIASIPSIYSFQDMLSAVFTS